MPHSVTFYVILGVTSYPFLGLLSAIWDSFRKGRDNPGVPFVIQGGDFSRAPARELLAFFFLWPFYWLLILIESSEGFVDRLLERMKNPLTPVLRRFFQYFYELGHRFPKED